MPPLYPPEEAEAQAREGLSPWTVRKGQENVGGGLSEGVNLPGQLRSRLYFWSQLGDENAGSEQSEKLP